MRRLGFFVFLAVFISTARAAVPYQLIVDYEVGGSEASYEAQFALPEWPGVDSGITIGIGYDVAGIPISQLDDDWKEAVSHRAFVVIYDASKIKGGNASKAFFKSHTRLLKTVYISFKNALNVFETKTMPRVLDDCRSIFPDFDTLPDPAREALASLVYNRGTSLQGSRRVQMYNIHIIMDERKRFKLADDKALKMIAQQIRAMKSLWPDMQGLQNRREAEAQLLESSVLPLL